MIITVVNYMPFDYCRNALAKELGIHRLIYSKTWDNATYSKGNYIHKSVAVVFKVMSL